MNRHIGGLRPHSIRHVPFLAAFLLSSCFTYDADPQDRMQILAELQRVELPRQAVHGPSAEDLDVGWTSVQASSWAITHNPMLAAARREMGIAEAELVEAGLLPEPELSWDAMDAIATRVTGDTPKSVDYISGLGLSWRLPRPGEVSSKVGIAEARKEEVRQRILEAEWALVRVVHRAWIAVVGAKSRLELNAKVLETAKKIADFFEEARNVRGATALQANLAAIEHAALIQARVRLQGELRLARQQLNAALGLRPDTKIPMRAAGHPFDEPAADANETADAETLTEEALHRRPDLEALFARYQALEENLRLEIARQWPEIAIGTGIALVLPIFSSFNAPAVRTAAARRERMAQRLRAAVHGLRAEVHAAVARFETERQQVQAYRSTLLPRIKENLRLTEAAFRAREVTLVEILTAQRQSLDTQRSYLEARIRKAEARLMMDTATGAVLTETNRRDEKSRKEKR